MAWILLRANKLGAKLTKQTSTPALFYHEKTNKVYTLEGKEVPVESPPRNLIIEYQDTLLTLPQLSLDQIRHHLTNDTIEYDKDLKAYYEIPNLMHFQQKFMWLIFTNPLTTIILILV